MKINQIAEMLNETFFPNETGESTTILKEDLSNLVDVGRTILEDTPVGTPAFEVAFKKIIDKVGKTIIVDRPYNSKFSGLFVDKYTYGNILEKIRIETPDFIETKHWDLANYDGSEIFNPSLPDVTAKYWNSKTTFSQKITTFRKQIESAFTSAENLSRFIGAIESRIISKRNIASDMLAKRTIVNLIAEKLKTHNNNINLYEIYKEFKPTATYSDFMNDPEFYRIVSLTIKKYQSYIEEPSITYNDNGFLNWTPKSDQRLFILSDIVMGMETYLYSDTYHEDYVRMSDYETIAMWQNQENRMDISVIPVSDENKNTIKEKIIGVLFDWTACILSNEDPEIESIYNPELKAYNSWYSFDCSYINDTNENVIVFYISEYSDKYYSDEPEDFTGNYYTRDIDGNYVVADSFTAGYYFKKI